MEIRQKRQGFFDVNLIRIRLIYETHNRGLDIQNLYD